MSASLPLFDEPEAVPPAPAAGERHLRAARQLSRHMGRLPDQSPEQLRAGHLICRHLIAMLEASAAPAKPPRAH
jgi:hypothetical protein